MNEELKIIISAVTAEAKKGIQDVNKELKGTESAANKGGGAMASMGKLAKGAATAMAAAAAAVVAVGAALVAVSKSTEEYRKSMAQLTSAFQANGSTAAQAKKTYGELYRFLGETDTAVEASNLLTQLTTDEKELAEWTKTLQGVYAKFPDSLPIEGLVEASNETARVGKVTGNLADALNWAGKSEDEFNAELAKTNTLSEREALIRTTLTGLYSDAAELYEENAAAILAQNEAQTRLNESTARLGEAATPLRTALTNLSATLLEALTPALEAVIPYLVTLVEWISKAVGWVTTFISALLGTNKSTEEFANSIEAAGTSTSKVVSGAGSIGDAMKEANAAAEKLKRTTQGFDELNVVSSGTQSSGGGASAPSYAIGAPKVSTTDLGLTKAFDETNKKAEEFAKKIKGVFEGLKKNIKNYATLFTPAFDAWKQAFGGLQQPAQEAFTSVKGTLETFVNESLIPFGSYVLEEFVPPIANAFSETIAPIFQDLGTFLIEEFAVNFEWSIQHAANAINDILIPALELLKTITIDTLNIIQQEWAKSSETLLGLFSGFLESIRSIWDTFYTEVLKPVLDIIWEACDGIWTDSLAPLLEKIASFFSKVTELILLLWNNILATIVNFIITVLAPVVVNAVNMIGQIFEVVFGAISDILGGFLDALGGVIDFILGVFTGDWERAWQGICDIFKGIWDMIWGIIKGVINLIIGAINTLWSAIYTIIAAIVNALGGIVSGIGSLFGQDWGWKMPTKAPTIPYLAKGGIVNSQTLAIVGERGKEAVLPLENNTEWMDTLADKLAARTAAPSKIVLMLDGKELGYAAINSINNITKQTGSLQLTLA